MALRSGRALGGNASSRDAGLCQASGMNRGKVAGAGDFRASRIIPVAD